MFRTRFRISTKSILPLINEPENGHRPIPVAIPGGISPVMAADFVERVYAVVARIPQGRVTTYGRIARALGSPRSARMVGWALNSCPAERDLPAHRVVNRNGVLTGALHFGHPDVMRGLLLAEDVTFLGEVTVDLEKHLWDPGDDPSLDHLAVIRT